VVLRVGAVPKGKLLTVPARWDSLMPSQRRARRSGTDARI